MKTPVVLVAAALTVAILVAASFLIVTETRGENALWRLDGNSAGKVLPASPDVKRWRHATSDRHTRESGDPTPSTIRII
jgi:hypothetical protein